MKVKREFRILLILSIFVTNFCSQSIVSAAAEKQPEDAESLAKKSQNPISDMMSLPFQYNWNTGGAAGTTRVLNIQPVIPLQLNNVVVR